MQQSCTTDPTVEYHLERPRDPEGKRHEGCKEEFFEFPSLMSVT